MNHLIEKRLVCRYRPLLVLPKGSTYFFDFECGEGWVDLLEGTLRLIERYAEEEKLNVRIFRVKETFGLLRIVQQGGDEMVDLIVEVTELVSGCICEICGREGNGWLQTRCDSHSTVDVSPTCGQIAENEQYIMNYAGTLGLILWFFKTDSVRWVQQKNRALGGRRPVDAMVTTEGCQAVYKLLKRLEYGVGV
ncbi:MbcA/ParS/Xre antitoxin family protein [Pseudomonas aeruginosa]|uniref:MbcA/ParS/Xre antitoxin family protein n=1 Tax=Pseudomonas aeruginosa TaxID=287 RepID=UPI000EABDB04|nr:MbcA/ParS/Xre antitoxin family protein [Pseudomonas aeruginosa]HBO2745108.1 DUF2384 domain-containing protein [Pseudomonas aeruginosa]